MKCCSVGKTTHLLFAPVLMALVGCAGTHTSRDSVTQRRSTELRLPRKQVAITKDEDAPAEQSSKSVIAPTSQKSDVASKISVLQASATEASEAPEADADVSELSRISSPAAQSSAATIVASQSDEPTVAGTESHDHATPAPQYTLSLANILQLADSQNPNVALARERINEAYSRVQRAETLWLPSLRTGLNYNYHDGSIQNVDGTVTQTTRNAFGGGLGANMYGAFSPSIPGVLAQFHFADAIFQPKIASHQQTSRRFGATAVRNDVLRDAAVAYLELVRAEHGLAIAQAALTNTEKLTELTRQYAQTGQGLQSDHERMEAELAFRREQLLSQQEALQVASSRLAQVLHADPLTLIITREPVVTPIELMAAEDSAAAHVVLGLSRRPELSEQKHLVYEAVERLNREKYAPLIPSVLLSMSYGGMAGGLGTTIANGSQRFDGDAIAYWELRNLGFGDRAAQGETASVARQAQMREVAVLDRVAREVVEAHTQVVQRKQRVQLCQQGITAAEQSYQLNMQRIENAQGLPIEVLQAVQALATAQRSYLNAVIDYNIAQFELCRATGWLAQS